MLNKKNEKFVRETVGNPDIANNVIDYLNRNGDSVGFEVFKNENGDPDKTCFHYAFKQNWTLDRFLKFLPVFYCTIERDERIKSDTAIDLENECEIIDDRYQPSFEEILDKDLESMITHNSWYPEDDDSKTFEEDSYCLKNINCIFEIYEKLRNDYTCKELLEYIYHYLAVNSYSDSKMWMIFSWNQYIDLCQQYGETDYCPKNFIYAFFSMKERDKQSIDLICPRKGVYDDRYYKREKDDLSFEFYWDFPVDNEGKLVERWLGVKTHGHEKKRIEGKTLIITAEADSIIEVFHSTEGKWKTVYSGPQNIDIDFQVIKQKRKQMGYSQTKVAKAIGSQVRTYQKWESGEVDGIKGFFLLRLMRYLDIELDEIAIDKGK